MVLERDDENDEWTQGARHCHCQLVALGPLIVFEPSAIELVAAKTRKSNATMRKKCGGDRSAYKAFGGLHRDPELVPQGEIVECSRSRAL